MLRLQTRFRRGERAVQMLTINWGGEATTQISGNAKVDVSDIGKRGGGGSNSMMDGRQRIGKRKWKAPEVCRISTYTAY